MNYRTASDEQLRKERLRLLNLQHIMQQRHASALARRGGRNQGFRSGSTAYGLERELLAIGAQLAEIEAELAFRTARQAATSTAAPATPPPAEEAPTPETAPAAATPPRRARRAATASEPSTPAASTAAEPSTPATATDAPATQPGRRRRRARPDTIS